MRYVIKMENILKITSQNVDYSLNSPDDDGSDHLFTGSQLIHLSLLHLFQHLGLADHVLRLLQLPDI